MQSSDAFDDIRWLTGPDAATWLDIAARESEASPALLARLRRGLSAQRAHLIVEQAMLRRRGREKFSQADRMFFTPLGLEQATDEAISQYKAAQMADRSANGSTAAAPLIDLCCGIGGDFVELARIGCAVGVDRDPVAVIFAQANLEASASGAALRSEVRIADVADFSVRDCRAWHVDPDRRPAGHRTTQAALHEPSPATIERLVTDCPRGAVKLAPGALLPEGWEVRCAELEWITSRRECRQLVAWFGELSKQPGRRSATMLSSGAHSSPVVQRSFCGEPNLPTPVAARIGRYVFEPDPSILAASLVGALAGACGIEAVTPRAAYLTGEPAPEVLRDAALACFEVLDVLPLRTKTLREWLRQRGMGRVEVKKRGVDVDPNRLAVELQGRGDGEATLLLCKLSEKAIAIIARRLSNGS